MENFFNEKDLVLITIYKYENNKLFYWETWNTDSTTAVIRWGEIGSYGEDKKISYISLSEMKDSLNVLINEKYAQGYKGIGESAYIEVALTMPLKEWGTPNDLRERHKLEGYIDEHLKWTANGQVVGGDIGSGEMCIYIETVIPNYALTTIPWVLEYKEVTYKVYAKVYKGDEIIRERFKLY